MARWIWKFGEFEIYHNLLLHNRRTQYGWPSPPVWKVCAPESCVRFAREVPGPGGTIRVWAKGDFAVTVWRGYEKTEYGGQHEIALGDGPMRVTVTVSNRESFPCLYVDGDLQTDESWTADDLAGDPAPADSCAWFDAPEKSPEVFPFAYAPVECVSRERLEGGALLDFGRETFARTAFRFSGKGDHVLRFGESREEAMSPDWCVIRRTVRGADRAKFEAQAFRYIFVDDPGAKVTAEYEYLPLSYRGAFRCDEDIVNRVWDTAAYTFHLNSREFFLDGIKRDRWVWSGDAYQSLFVNRYLFLDRELERRTLIALAGKPPFEAHINGIVDYTFYWMIGLYEYYETYGDADLLRRIFPQARRIMDFCRSRADADGFVRGKQRDWVFIDWAPMDREGALCGEQVLFARALEAYGSICALLSEDSRGAAEQARALQAAVLERFWDDEKGAFVDSYESGKRFVSRHSNILAYLFLPMDDARKASLYAHAILDDSVPQITTPYFKFYENLVHCEAGSDAGLERSIREYFGGMLRLGATTLYEQFDPNETGPERFAMYGHPFEKSLCHAWSCNPIYLLGRYRAGVRRTGVGYQTFEVAPRLGDLKRFDCTVPLPAGEVRVRMDGERLTVRATAAGGTLVFGGQRLPLQAGQEVSVAVR